jgi:hypothetical protein
MSMTADPDAADEMGRSGRRYAAEVLDEEAAISAYDEWISELAGRAGLPEPTGASGASSPGSER